MSLLNRETLLKLGEIDPELDAWLKANPIPPADYSDLTDFRNKVEARNTNAMKALGDAPPEVKVTEVFYSTEDGTKMRAKLYQPVNPPKDGSPLIVMYHGGGFCLGIPEGEELACRNFVQAFGAVCLSPAYRLAPEFKFPHAIKDSFDALKFAAANAQSWGADPSSGFIIGGTSAGGNITACLAHLARDENLSPPLTGQYLSIPAVLPHDVVPEKYKPYYLSYEQNAEAPVLPKAAVEMFGNAYESDNKDGIYYAAFNHPKGHAHLPPAFFQIDGLDPLRDEAIIYEHVLREDYGLKTRMNIYPGLPHSHWSFFPFLKSSHKFRKEQVEGIAWLLGRTPDQSKVRTGLEPLAWG